MTIQTIQIAQDPAADALLTRDPFALVVGMLLDQQFPMERAFAGPYLIAERMGTPERLDPVAIAGYDPEGFRALMTGPPAVHRYPGSMGERVQQLARLVVDQYDGDVTRLWSTTASGDELFRRLSALPGYGKQKAQIFTALLAKQLGVTPTGWEAVAGAYAEPGIRRSVADVRDATTLAEVREFKQQAKAAAKAARSSG